jgi:hypothetical protein
VNTRAAAGRAILWHRNRSTPETVSMADRQLWNVRCTAHRTDGLPCRAWSIRGSYVCRVHGGRAPQVRAAAEFRLWRARLWISFARDLSAALAALDERWRTEPEVMKAETLAWLRQAEYRLARFRALNGRLPRTAAERSLIVDGGIAPKLPCRPDSACGRSQLGP